MRYICERDYEYIKNKYHDTSKPFNPYWRFVRRDEIFDAGTGMAPEEIADGLKRLDDETLPHPVRKANAFAYVLESTRIACDERDHFPAINMLDRPLDFLINKWHSEVFSEKIPKVKERMDRFSYSLATIIPDYCHSVPVWDRLLSLGFSGILKESKRMRSENAASRALTEDEKAFYDGITITYTAIIRFVGRLAALAAKNSATQRMAKALCNLQCNPPATFYEALLLNYLYFVLCEHIESMQVRSLSHFDRLYYPLYKSDLDKGVSEEELRRDLAYFMVQFPAIGHPQQNPVYFGGCKKDGETEINPLSYVFLEVYDELGLFNPKIQIKLAENTPKEFVLKALAMIRKGHNSILFISDTAVRKSLMYYGATEEEARTCDIKGCAEYAPRDAMSMGMNYMNALKALEFAMHAGCDGVSGEFMGLQSPGIDEIDTFEALYDEYKKQLKHCVEMVIDTVNGFEGYLSYISPQSMFSGTSLSCLKNAKCAMAGGAAFNDSELEIAALADVCDSLTIIKKYIFDQKLLTLAELKTMLDKDFEGNEVWQKHFLLDGDKYGNNKELPDYFAKDISDFLTDLLRGKKNARGGNWCFGYHVAEMIFHMSGKTLASPNGRVRGVQLSKNASPTMGQNREGVTAAILSNTKMDLSRIYGNATLDVAFLSSSVKGEDGLEAMYALLQAFVKRGGNSININVFNSDILKVAQREPEQYQDLQIRVCGWNVLFNNMSKEEQDGFIRQAESLV